MRAPTVQPGAMMGGESVWRAIAPVAALALLASACAAPSQHYGIALAPGAALPELQNLARRAAAGDKHAQLDLGIRYEEGNGVPRDLKRAKQLYRLAATPSGGTMYVYTPPVRKGGKGMVTPMNMGPRIEGLEEAKRRLQSMGKHSASAGGSE